MPARFEVRREEEGFRPYRVQLCYGDDGAVIADLGRFPSLDEVKAAIASLREGAAQGLVVDLTGGAA
jgi:uncharacterized protein YegP (UPF0339 family)